MPRRNAIPEREREIGRRLKQYRESIYWGRPAFAKNADLDSSLLFRYESGRVPIKYSDGARFVSRFTVNPRWLATGKGPMVSPTRLPTASELKVSEPILFSEVFDTHLDAMLPEQPIGSVFPMKPDWTAEGRVIGEERLMATVSRLVEAVPDAQFQAVEVAAFFQLCKLVHTEPKDDPCVVVERARAMEVARAKRSERRNAIDSKTLDSLNYPVPNLSTADDPWLELLSRVRALTSASGRKKALAELLGVTPAAVSQWLDGSTTPRAETALRLLNWVLAEEAAKKKQVK